MAFAWVANLGQEQRQVYSPTYEGATLTVSGRNGSWIRPSTYILDGEATAIYGPDRLVANHLEAHLAKSEGFLVADGAVQLTDPDGTLQADHLKATWRDDVKSLEATKVFIKVAGATIRAETVFITPDEWTLTGYFITTDKGSRPLLSVSGDSVSVRPGKVAHLRDSQPNLFGRRLFGIRDKSFSLDPRTSGIRPPTPEYRFGKGLGYNWVTGFLLRKDTDLELHSDASAGDLPGYGVQITKSLVPLTTSPYPITPRSEFTDRFSFGYFDNVLVSNAKSEVNYLREEKKAISVASIFNAGVTGRGASGEVFTVPAAAIYEVGGKVGGAGYLSDLRLEGIDRYRQPYVGRAVFSGSLELPVIKVAPNLFNLARLDASIFESDTSFAWARGTEALIYSPNRTLAFGAAAFFAADAGTPEFDIDPLFYKNGFALRGDWTLGPRSLSVLSRYDTGLGWFDHELKITQAVGSLQAFIIYRKYPGDLHYGVTFRLDEFEDLLTRRNWKSSKKVDATGLP